MANPRELAEQAFALLQNALSESEARASDLDEQLKRKRSPKNRLEEQLDVLTHRLEKVEAERAHWEQQAGHLEEIAEAERAKVAQLKKKLEIAESGPEKLTKKEVNFWRAKADTIDAQIKEYQERLAALRRDLNERDAELEKQRASGGTHEAAPAEPQPEAENELRRQLEQRDQWLAELRLELHELRGQPTPPLETEAELETLRSQITSLERALAEAHNMRAAAEADAIRYQHTIAERDRAVREAHEESERTIREVTARHAYALQEAVARHEQALRATAADHEQALADVIAERDRIANELAAERNRIAQHAADEVSRLMQEAAAERERAVSEAVAEHERSAREATAASEHARATLADREHRIVELTAEVEQLRNELRQRDELDRANADRYEEQVAALTRDTEELRARIEQDRHDTSAARAALELAIHEREQKIERQQQQLLANERQMESLRSQLGERDQAAAEARREADEQRREADEQRREADEQRQRADEQLRSLDECRRELEELQQRARDLSQAVAARDEQAAAHVGELEQARVTLAGQEQEIDSLRSTLESTHRELGELRAAKAHLEETIAASAREMEAAREQIAGLEAELKEEREHAESLGELANERREHMTKLQEQVEEAEERYADANWRLGKALYFERIVKRRKGLIQKLLAALRAKMKANVALKAGLDGLRTYKQTAEMNQHKLLQRIDSLNAELKEAEETVKRHQGATAAKEELTNAIARAAALEERLNTQAELIQSLEADLKTARLTQKAGGEHNDDVARLTKELEAKNQIIEKLQADTDEQQRKLAKLRGSESETVRLRALTEKDRGEIDALQREVAQLREALARQAEVAASSNNNAELEARLKERESSLTRLMGTIKEHEAAIKEHESTIKRLTESAESWKRKYQFLASDQPDAYKTPAEK